MFYKRILKMEALATSLGVTFFLVFSLAAEASSSPTIRVKILEKESIQAGATGAFRVVQVEGKGNIRHFPASSFPLRVESSPSGIKIDQRNWGSSVWIIPETDGSLCLVDWRRYRGSLLIKKKGKFLEVINELPLEEYLYGVIKWEISPDWPLVAVAAQAIAARTYALKKLETSLPENQDYHLLSTEDDQVYGGVESEDPRVRKAVDSTRGQVLTYERKLINAYYNACCGGYTASSADIWGGEDLPYLRVGPDKFCQKSPRYNWKWEIKRSELRKILLKERSSVDIIYRLQVLSRVQNLSFEEGGRVTKLCLEHQGGKLYLTGTKFRKLIDKWIGRGELKSTLFDEVRLQVKGGASYFVFTGKGSGHGVGMCQWGVRGMAEKGYSTKEILQFYYPGTTIEKRY